MEWKEMEDTPIEREYNESHPHCSFSRALTRIITYTLQYYYNHPSVSKPTHLQHLPHIHHLQKTKNTNIVIRKEKEICNQAEASESSKASSACL